MLSYLEIPLESLEWDGGNALPTAKEAGACMMEVCLREAVVSVRSTEVGREELKASESSGISLSGTLI